MKELLLVHNNIKQQLIDQDADKWIENLRESKLNDKNKPVIKPTGNGVQNMLPDLTESLLNTRYTKPDINAPFHILQCQESIVKWDIDRMKKQHVFLTEQRKEYLQKKSKDRSSIVEAQYASQLETSKKSLHKLEELLTEFQTIIKNKKSIIENFVNVNVLKGTTTTVSREFIDKNILTLDDLHDHISNIMRINDKKLDNK